MLKLAHQQDTSRSTPNTHTTCSRIPPLLAATPPTTPFLPPDAGSIHSLAWSPDSELLALVTAPAQSSVAATPCATILPWQVQIWHRNNWHWQLKRVEQIEGVDAQGAVLARWEEGRTNVLHVVTGGGLCRRLQLTWGRHVSAKGTVAVVDGASLLLTPFRSALGGSGVRG